MIEKLTNNIKESLKKLDIDFNDILVERPSKKENGDYASNIALKLTKLLKEDPMKIAEKIKNNINNDCIEKIEIVKPGFINFFLNKKYLYENIDEVIKLGSDYGRNNLCEGKNYNVEFVSANPTGILHLGNARGGAYGDSLARILRFSGAKVTEEYYVNDAGNQINNLGLSIQARYFELLNRESHMPENGYYGKEIIAIAKNLYEKYQDTLVDKDIEFYKEIGINELLGKIKKVLKDYRINFDVYTSERSIIANTNMKSMLDTMGKNGYTYKKDGALWLKSSELGDSKDHVLIKNDGLYTYLVPDIAYHVNKIKRGFTNLIDVLGTDHHGYVARLKGSLQALGYDRNILDVKLLQLVRLVKDNVEVKMSKRSGNAVSLQELLEEVGINATRYFFTMRSLDTQMDFDLEMAKKTSNENPVYYISYAYARICTILAKAPTLENVAEYLSLNDEYAYNVLEKVYEFPNVVKQASLKQLPHLITNYVYDLANSFHIYYSKNRIITDNKAETMERLRLITAVKITLKNALDLIGVIPPEKM